MKKVYTLLTLLSFAVLVFTTQASALTLVDPTSSYYVYPNFVHLKKDTEYTFSVRAYASTDGTGTPLAVTTYRVTDITSTNSRDMAEWPKVISTNNLLQVGITGNSLGMEGTTGFSIHWRTPTGITAPGSYTISSVEYDGQTGQPKPEVVEKVVLATSGVMVPNTTPTTPIWIQNGKLSREGKTKDYMYLSSAGVLRSLPCYYRPDDILGELSRLGDISVVSARDATVRANVADFVKKFDGNTTGPDPYGILAINYPNMAYYCGRSTTTPPASQYPISNTSSLRISNPSLTASSIKLDWNLPTAVPVSEAYRVGSYEIYATEYDTQGNSLGEKLQTTIPAGTTYTLTYIKKDTKYTVTVKGKSSAGNIVTNDTLTQVLLQSGGGSSSNTRVTLVSPNGGETWVVGSTQKITYSLPSGTTITSTNPLLVYVEREGTMWRICKQDTNAGTCSYTVEQAMLAYFNGATTGFKIKVCAGATCTNTDSSDGTISILYTSNSPTTVPTYYYYDFVHLKKATRYTFSVRAYASTDGTGVPLTESTYFTEDILYTQSMDRPSWPKIISPSNVLRLAYKTPSLGMEGTTGLSIEWWEPKGLILSPKSYTISSVEHDGQTGQPKPEVVEKVILASSGTLQQVPSTTGTVSTLPTPVTPTTNTYPYTSSPSGSVSYDTSKYVLQINQREILIRGYLQSVSGDSFVIRTHGGTWTANISPNTEYVSLDGKRPVLKAGDYVGVRGFINQSGDYTFTTTALRNRTLYP